MRHSNHHTNDDINVSAGILIVTSAVSIGLMLHESGASDASAAILTLVIIAAVACITWQLNKVNEGNNDNLGEAQVAAFGVMAVCFNTMAAAMVAENAGIGAGGVAGIAIAALFVSLLMIRYLPSAVSKGRELMGDFGSNATDTKPMLSQDGDKPPEEGEGMPATLDGG